MERFSKDPHCSGYWDCHRFTCFLDKITPTKITFILPCFGIKLPAFSYGYWGCHGFTCFWTKLPVSKLAVSVSVQKLHVSSLSWVWNYLLSPMNIEVATDLPVFGQNYLYPPLFLYKITRFVLWILRLPWIYLFLDKITCNKITCIDPWFDIKLIAFSYGYWGCHGFTCFWTKLPLPKLPVSFLDWYKITSFLLWILWLPQIYLFFGQNYQYQNYVYPPLFWYKITHFLLLILRLPRIYLFFDKNTCTKITCFLRCKDFV